MVIGGIQKLSLIDFPGKIATVVFTQGCDLLCPFCHNPELIPFKGDGVILESDVFAHLAKNAKMIEGVCITGGEPTSQPDIIDFLGKIKSLGLAVKLDTNGSSPEALSVLLDEGLLDYVAMDIKSSWENYPRVIGSPKAAHVAEKAKISLEFLVSSGAPHEFRTTVFPGRHDVSDFISIAGYLSENENYFLQDMRFEKTLGNIEAEGRLSAARVAKEIAARFPHLSVFAR